MPTDEANPFSEMLIYQKGKGKSTMTITDSQPSNAMAVAEPGIPLLIQLLRECDSVQGDMPSCGPFDGDGKCMGRRKNCNWCNK